jgi:hypothetical protein
MANESAASAATGGDGQRLMTLTEVAKRTKLSMPTLQKYKKRYGDRIPSVGKGRTQRYPEKALPVFEQLREENLARRGRPRKDAAAAPPRPRRRGRRRQAGAVPAVPANGRRRRRRGRPRQAAGGGERLLTLTEIQQQTKISYPTLLRYVKTHGRRIPSVGSGRRRRYKPEAVAVFQKLRSESRRGRRPASGAKAAGARRGRPPGARQAGAGKRRGRPPGSGAKRRGRPPGRPPAAAGGGLGARVTSLLRKLEQRLAKIENEIKKPLRLVRS